jgi:hypothetical protein
LFNNFRVENQNHCSILKVIGAVLPHNVSQCGLAFESVLSGERGYEQPSPTDQRSQPHQP